MQKERDHPRGEKARTADLRDDRGGGGRRRRRRGGLRLCGQLQLLLW